MVDDVDARKVGEWQDSQYYKNYVGRGYVHDLGQGKGEKTLASSTMIWTGLYVLIFFVTHLLNIKFASHEPFGDEGMRDIHATTLALFQNPFYVVFYVVAVCLLGLHVSHGLQSAFRTVGIQGKRSTPKIEKASIAFGWIVALGYSSIPLWAILIAGGEACPSTPTSRAVRWSPSGTSTASISSSSLRPTAGSTR